MELIYENNTKYFLTITFPHNTSNASSEILLNRLIVELNRSIYKKRYLNHSEYLKGLAIREYTSKMSCAHYHITIFENATYPLPEIKSLEKKLNKAVKFINKSTNKNGIHTFKLQEYYETGKLSLEKYVTKQFDGFSHQDMCNDSMGILDSNGAIFGIN